jgi:hypothetical protein
VLLVVVGVVLLGLAAGFAAAIWKLRRIRRAVAAAGYLQDDPAATTARRRLAICGVVALAGIGLIVAGSVWPPG